MKTIPHIDWMDAYRKAYPHGFCALGRSVRLFRGSLLAGHSRAAMTLSILGAR